MSIFRYRSANVSHQKARRSHKIRVSLESLETRALLTTYSVGPGQPYATIGSVPWSSVGAGDTVAIHWQADPYREKILISGSGTPTQPLRVVGVPGPNGQQPVIDGQNATTSSQFRYSYDPQQANALVLVQRSADHPYAYKPSNIAIEGLEFRNAYFANSFTDSRGVSKPYAEFAAAIYVQGANNVTIRNNTLTTSGLGLFVLSNGDEAHTTRNVMVDGNSIYGNGVPNQYLQHNVYAEALGITYQNNYFGPLRSGSAGNNLKDRSAGVVIRNNYFAAGGHLIDLVDAEDSGIIASDPSYATTAVYGNVLDNTGPNAATFVLHFGGDSGATNIYRKHLDFYNNTVVNIADQSARWRTILFQLDTRAQVVDARNNIFYAKSSTPGATPTMMELAFDNGTLNFATTNWISDDWVHSHAREVGLTFGGTISGTNNLYVDPANNPGFASMSPLDVHLVPGSSAVDKAGELASGALPVDRQYVAPTSSQPRPVNGAASDLGAFEAGRPATRRLRR